MRTPSELIKDFSGREGFTMTGSPLSLAALQWAVEFIQLETLEEAKQAAVGAVCDDTKEGKARQGRIEGAVRGLLVEQEAD